MDSSITASSLFIPIRLLNEQSLPKQLLNLGSDFNLTKINEHEFILENESGFVNQFEQSFRNIKKQPFSIGDEIQIGELSLTIVQINEDQQPTIIKLNLNEQGNTVFIRYQQGSFDSYTP